MRGKKFGEKWGIGVNGGGRSGVRDEWLFKKMGGVVGVDVDKYVRGGLGVRVEGMGRFKSRGRKRGFEG